jgi:hypothetical protein
VGSDEPAPIGYIESIADFLLEEDPPVTFVFPELLPTDVIMLIHGDPRARKSLSAFELALSAANGNGPVRASIATGHSRPSASLYIQEEDPRSLTRPRLRRLVTERCGDRRPDTLHVFDPPRRRPR